MRIRSILIAAIILLLMTPLVVDGQEDSNLVPISASNAQEITLLTTVPKSDTILISLSHDPATMIEVDQDGTIWRKNAGTRVQIPTDSETHISYVFEDSAGNYLIGFDYQHRRAIVWDASTYTPQATFENLTTGSAYAFVMPPNLLGISGYRSGSSMLWNLDTQEQIATLNGPVLDTSGTFLVYKVDTEAHVWDTTRRKEIITWNEFREFEDATLSEDHSWLAIDAGQYNHTISYIVDISSPPSFRDIVSDQGFSPIFSPDGTTAAYVEYKMLSLVIHLVDLETGKDLAKLDQIEDASDFVIEFSPDGSILLGWSSEGTVWLWDVAKASEVKVILTYDYLSDVSFSPDSTVIDMVTGDGQQQWGIPVTPLEVAENMTSGSAQASGQAFVLGTANPALAGASHIGRTSCSSFESENVLAIAQSADGDMLAYLSFCEGPVWLSSGTARDINWTDLAALHQLPVITRPEVSQLLEMAPEDYDRLCDAATQWTTPPDGQPALLSVYIPQPGRAFATSTMLPALLATADHPPDVVLCNEYSDQLVETCYYIGDTGKAQRQRIRRDTTIRMVDVKTGMIFAQRTFTGSAPATCPDKTTDLGDIVGPEGVAPGDWIMQTLYPGASLRTMVVVGSANARSEPGTTADIITQLPYQTPISLIGRNEAGDWVAVLMPDMTKAWLHISLIQPALGTSMDALPIVSGPAADIPLAQ